MQFSPVSCYLFPYRTESSFPRTNRVIRPGSHTHKKQETNLMFCVHFHGLKKTFTSFFLSFRRSPVNSTRSWKTNRAVTLKSLNLMSLSWLSITDHLFLPSSLRPAILKYWRKNAQPMYHGTLAVVTENYITLTGNGWLRIWQNLPWSAAALLA
jgi:hypothetical protein